MSNEKATLSGPRKRILGAVVAVMVFCASVWGVLAWQAGSYLSPEEDDSYAIGPDDPKMEAFSKNKKYVDVGSWRVAYIDEGEGEPVFLLHGCPFHSYEWKDIIPQLSSQYRVIAPDLLGLGDTQVRLTDDYRLPNDVEMVNELMEILGIESAHFVGHDHGGATLQLMMDKYPNRINRAVLTNAEAYDQWPSKPEIPYLKMIINPVTGPIFRTLMANSVMFQQEIFSIAVHHPDAFTDEIVGAYARAHTATPERWQRLVRFFKWQLDEEHNAVTMTAVDAMRRFENPTLMVWGKQDTNFGPELAERLAGDIPGTVGIVWMEESAHMPMQEQPEEYAQALLQFFAGDFDDGILLNEPETDD